MYSELSNVSNTNARVSGKRRRVRSNAGWVGGNRRLRVRDTPELKSYNDVYGYLTSSNVIDSLFNNFTPGLGGDDRVGSRIRLRSIQWRCVFEVPGYVTPEDTCTEPNLVNIKDIDCYMNFLIIQDLQSNGGVTNPSFDQVFEDTLPPPHFADPGCCFRERANSGRFKVLSRQQLRIRAVCNFSGTPGWVTTWVGDGSGGLNNTTAVPIRWYGWRHACQVRCQGFLNVDIPVTFNNVSGDLPTRNNIFFVIAPGYSPGLHLASIQCYVNQRISFTDE